MIELRPVLESDAEELFPYVYKTAVTDTLVWDGPKSIEEYREALKVREERTKAGEDLIYTMLDETGAGVGSIGLSPDRANRSATVGLWIGLPFHGLGYGTEAVRQVCGLGLARSAWSGWRRGSMWGMWRAAESLRRMGFSWKGR